MRESEDFIPRSPEQPPKSLELAKFLEQTDDSEEIKSRLGDLLTSIERDVGRSFTADVAAIYREMYEEQCLARIERLSRVLETVEQGHSLVISDAHEPHYANAVLPTTKGLHIAFSEGQAPGPVRAVIGFGKTLIGFKTDRLKVEEVDFTESDIRDAAERKFLCRHVSGVLKKEDIRHLVMRIPANLLSKEMLTEEEKRGQRRFMFRGMDL